MDSIATQPNLKPHHHHPSFASKLPIKRKTLNPPPLSITPTIDNDPPSIPISISTVDFNPKPFKFQRIWTESDEILLLQGLLSSSTDGLSLSTFYNNFSNTTPHLYSKSQLSQKLRRLRKKFRQISSRLSRGSLNISLLSPHDRALFDLSNQLWNPNPNPKSNHIINYSSNNISLEYAERVDLVGVKVSFSPAFSNDFGPLDSNAAFDDYNDLDVEKTKNLVVKSVSNTFNECLNEVIEKERLRCLVVNNNNDNDNSNRKDFQSKWKLQKLAEIDVFAKRLNLLIENSVNKFSSS